MFKKCVVSAVGLVLVASSSALSAEEKKIGSTLNKKVAIALSDIPAQALAAIHQIKPDFVPEEVEKEFKHGNEYLDVEGDNKGSEIEFDMLFTDAGWEVVEIQRDLTLDQLPKGVLTSFKSTKSLLAPKRIIESVQHGTDITVYEFYSVNEQGIETRTEVKLENGVATLLDKEWTH